jgi:hypothetical protein
MSALYHDSYGELGLPTTYYRQESTRAAILVYVRHMADPRFEPAPTAAELRLVVEYCAYFINAPCWKYPARELRMLRASIEHVKSAHELATWLWGCVQIGIDPL